MQVLVDMHARDIRPDAHNWTVLAGHEMGSAEKIDTRAHGDPIQPTLTSSSFKADKTQTLTGPVSPLSYQR